MPFALIAEAVLRIEHKLDALLRFTCAPVMPMHFVGQACPACQMPVDYTVDIKAGVVVRRCECKTGKVAATLPLMPVTQGEQRGLPSESVQLEGADQPPRSSRRKAR